MSSEPFIELDESLLTGEMSDYEGRYTIKFELLYSDGSVDSDNRLEFYIDLKVNCAGILLDPIPA